MPRIENDVKLDFKDVLIRPKRSTLKSRSEVELDRTYVYKVRRKTNKRKKGLKVDVQLDSR